MASVLKKTVTGNGDTIVKTIPAIEYIVKVGPAAGSATVTVKDADGDAYGAALSNGQGEIYTATGNTITLTTASHSVDFDVTVSNIPV